MMKLSRHLYLIALMAMLLVTAAAPAAAVDGVLEINQACAAVGCFSGDSAGFPVEVTNPGSYRLTGNLAVSTADTTAIKVTADDVTIDLNGFEIAGPTSCTGVPLVCSPVTSGDEGVGVFSTADETVVRNGAIHGMGRLCVLMMKRGRAENLMMSECAEGGFNGDSGGVVRNSQALHNGGVGITCMVAVNNVAIGNSGSGLAVRRLAKGNVASDNASYGVFFLGTGGYAGNHFSSNNGGDANAQVGGSGALELGPNICGGDTTCP